MMEPLNAPARISRHENHVKLFFFLNKNCFNKIIMSYMGRLNTT